MVRLCVPEDGAGEVGTMVVSGFDSRCATTVGRVSASEGRNGVMGYVEVRPRVGVWVRQHRHAASVEMHMLRQVTGRLSRRDEIHLANMVDDMVADWETLTGDRFHEASRTVAKGLLGMLRD